MRILALSAGAIVVIAVVSLLVLFMYIRGGALERKLEVATGEALSVEGGFEDLRFRAIGKLRSASYNATGLESLRAIDAHSVGIDYDLFSLFGDVFHIEGLSIDSLDLVFAESDHTKQSDTTTVQRSPEIEGRRGFIAGELDINEMRVGRLDVLWKGGQMPIARLRDAAAAARFTRDGTWDIDLDGGRLVMPGQPALALENASLRIRYPEFFLNSSSWLMGEGRVAADGQIDSSKPSSGELQLQFEGVPTSSIFPESMHSHLSGRASGRMSITSPLTQPVWRGEISIENARVIDVPLLDMLALVAGSRTSNDIVFDTAKADVLKKNDYTKAGNIHLESRGTMILTGYVEVENGRLNGDLQLGIAETQFGWLQQAGKSIFSQHHNGYWYTEFQLSGTIDNPRENLSSRIAQTLPESIVNQAASILAPGNNSEDAVRKGSDMLKKAAEHAEKSLLDLLTP